MIREDAIRLCEDFIKNHSDWSVEEEWSKGVEYVLEDYKRLANQKPILDKIRAEIDDATEIHSDGEFYIKNIDAKRIIDKYKAESEDKDGVFAKTKIE